MGGEDEEDKMRRSSTGFHSLLAAAALIAFAASAHAQPSTNGPTGNGPEGAPRGIVFGSGVNMPGTAGPVVHRHVVLHRHEIVHRHLPPPQ
jgi:hypothetical protein